MNLSKTFDTLNCNLFLTKLKSYGFSENVKVRNALKLLCSYLKDRRQAVQINDNFSSYEKIQAGVPLSIKLFTNDRVIVLSEKFLGNYSDDSNLY